MKFILVLAAVLAALAALAHADSSARPDNPCTQSWQPGKVYDDLDCPGDVNAWIKWTVPRVIGPALCIVIGILTPIILGLTCCARYCCNCCGGSRPREGCCCGESLDRFSDTDLARDKSDYNTTWLRALQGAAVFLLLVSGAGLALSFAGATKASQVPDRLADGVANLVNWVFSILDQIVQAIQKSRTPKTFAHYSEVQKVLQEINSTHAEFDRVRQRVNDAADQVRPIGKLMIGLAGPTAAIVLAGILATIAALVKVKNYLPIITITLVALTAPAVGILGGVAGVAEIPFDVWCDEVRTYRNGGTRGVFPQLLLPKLCNATAAIGKLKNRLNLTIAKFAQEGCTAMQSHCGEYFVGINCDKTKKCNSISDFQSVLQSIHVSVPIQGVCDAGSCDLNQCIKYCPDSGSYTLPDSGGKTVSYPNVKDSAGTVLYSLQDASMLLNVTFNIVDTYLQCGVIINEVLENIDFCSSDHGVETALEQLYAGASISLTVCVLLPVVMFMGQKRFFSREQDGPTKAVQYADYGPFAGYGGGKSSSSLSGGREMAYSPAHGDEEEPYGASVQYSALGDGSGMTQM